MSQVIFDSCRITNNIAMKNGGGIYYDTYSSGDYFANLNPTDSSIDLDSLTIIEGNSADLGGGMYMLIKTISNGGHPEIYNPSGDTITINLNVNGAKIRNNSSTNGGGVYMIRTDMVYHSSINLNYGNIADNTASSFGGGIYASGGIAINVGDASISDSLKVISNSAKYGGGIYISDGDIIVNNGFVGMENKPNMSIGGNGGAIYLNNGNITVNGGHVDYNQANRANNEGGSGGAFYAEDGTATINGGSISYNKAELNGGGFYVNAPNSSALTTIRNGAFISKNEATNGSGGGIYAQQGNVEFSDGYIQYNYASEQGGGIYIGSTGALALKGSAHLLGNHVPSGHEGGGVYLKGVLTIGEQLPEEQLGIIDAQYNFAHTLTGSETAEEYATSGIADSTRNNVYLPEPEVRDDHTDVITIIENGIKLDSKIGFSVPHGNVPVIYCAYSPTSRAYLHQFSTGQDYQYSVFDDTDRYTAVQYDNVSSLDPDHVYLYGFWTNEVTGDTEEDYCEVDLSEFDNDTILITTPCELAYFISWVNGRSNLTPHPNANAKLMADIDMSEFGWVPIGHLTQGYKGHFDGNGHTVSGIISMLNTEYTDYGFFGRLNGGTVKNLFIKDATYLIEKKKNHQLYIGAIAGTTAAGSVIENCEASAVIFSDTLNTVMGGLVGKQDGGVLHSSIGIAEITGNLIGGLVGDLESGGNLRNSFANAKLNRMENADAYYGGLIGKNSGTVENCYVRLLDNTVLSDSDFGILVGDNTDGTVNYCYAPDGMTHYKVTGAAPNGSGTYGITQLPYLYKHRDTQVDANNDYVPTGTDADKQLMIVLNRWVDTINSKQSAINYTKWGRPWQESDAQKPLNDDYPILKMPMGEAVAAEAGDPYLYYNPVDSLLVRYTDAESAIWVYRNPSDTVRGDNSTSAAKLYIAEDVVLLNANALKAYVGITLDNSAGAGGAYPTYFPGVPDATDWHMIATPLSDAPIGINYDNGTYDFDYGHPSGMPYYLFYPKDDAKHGYFPSHRFGKEYPGSAATIEEGNYYTEWDFYSYYEPEYHWINFKRNSASHGGRPLQHRLLW